MKLKPGDKVSCKIKNNNIVGCYESDYEETINLEIVGVEEGGYYLHIPIYRLIINCFVLTPDLAKKHSINKKYMGEKIKYISPYNISNIIEVLDGTCCTKCAEFIRFAEPNNQDGSFICWSCKTNPYR